MEEDDRVEIDEVHRQLVFSFLRTLRTIRTKNTEMMDGITVSLAQEFGIDAGGVGGVHDADIDLVGAFKDAVAKREAQHKPQNDDKFAEFLEILKKKGYFNGVTEGTEEHAARIRKAREKYAARNNPYEGLTADQLKTRGNELMGQAKYHDAVKFYTKAIELEPTNHIFYANRAAAHTHLKDYRSAIIDCEKSISINESYSKAYSRLGTALFYDSNYQRAVDAYQRACQLEPENETYKADLKQAEEKLKTSGGNNWGQGGNRGLPGFPGAGFDFGSMAQAMNNPEFMSAAMKMMQNPAISEMVQKMATKFGQDPEAMAEFARSMGSAGPGSAPVDENGNLVTPMGRINAAALEQLKRDELHSNPKFAAIVEDVQRNGFAAMQKYLGDPDVLQLMDKFQSLLDNRGGGGAASSS